MKVTLLPENIIKYLPLINRVLPSHSQIPILSNVLLSAEKNGFCLKSTDLEMGIKITIPAKIDEEGEITVPGKEFLETVNNLPKDKLVMQTDKDTLRVECRGSRAIFNTIPSAEFPDLFKEKGEKVATITKKEFLELFSSITFSVSQEDTRPQLTGILIDPVEGGVNFVSTDGYRMSIKKSEGQKVKNKEGLILSVKLINEAGSLKDEEGVDIFVNNTENQVIFVIGDATLVGRIIAGPFPDYKRVLPAGHRLRAVFDREELLQVAKLVSIFARDNSNIAIMKIEKGVITLQTKSQGVGEGVSEVECQQDGEDMSVSFNIKYLYDVLRAADGKTLEIRLNSPSEPVVFEDKEKRFLHVIMPIQVE